MVASPTYVPFNWTNTGFLSRTLRPARLWYPVGRYIITKSWTSKSHHKLCIYFHQGKFNFVYIHVVCTVQLKIHTQPWQTRCPQHTQSCTNFTGILGLPHIFDTNLHGGNTAVLPAAYTLPERTSVKYNPLHQLHECLDYYI